MPADPWLTLGALSLEAVVGYPAALHRRLPHPVVWLGGLIDALERAWNRSIWSEATRRALGGAALGVVVGLAAATGWVIEHLPLPSVVLTVLMVVVATLGLAQRSLYDHVAAVARPLSVDDLAAARQAVGAIVGRDTASLDQSGVAGAAIESLAESFNDGVVAPVFWLLIGGLPGLFAYKAINTADSLIGHKEPRWRAFGWAAARTDDLVNLIPARLAGVLIALAAGGGWRTMILDAPGHASPNAGWPEAAMAGGLGVRLGGPATYDGVSTDRPTFGRGPAPAPSDLKRALRIYIVACGLLWLGLALGGLAWRR